MPSAPLGEAAPRLGNTTKDDDKTMHSRPIAWSNNLQQSKSPRSAPARQDKGQTVVGAGPQWGQNDSQGQEKGEAGKTRPLARATPVASSGSDTGLKKPSLLQSGSTNGTRHDTPRGDPDEDQ